MPESERLGEQRSASLRVRAQRFAAQAHEAVRIDVFGLERQPVAGRLGDENAGPERLAQRPDGVLERTGGGRGRSLAPDHGHESIGRDDLASPQRERCEERPLLAAGKRNDPIAVLRLERPKEAYLHRLVVTPATNVSK